MIFKEVSGKPDDDGVVQLNNQILQKVYKYMAGMHMIEKKSHVIAGISGGADSMCLLFVLLSIQKTMELELTAVHINHGLRGAEADEDQAFVQHFCARHHVECICFKTDIRAYAKKERMTEEEAGRKYRYACFEKVRVQKDADVIAVAHHRDDLAETVLWNLVRGTGLQGMAGILPLREYIIRPLLILQRAEIEALLTAYNIDYRTDCTNLEAAYTRNRLRLHVMPYLTEHINRQASAHLAQAAETFGEVWHYIERQTLQAWKDAADEEGRIDVVRFAEEDIVIQKELIRMLIQKKSGRLKDITQRHIEAVRGLASKPTGRCVSLPYGLTAIREGVYLAIEKNEDQVQKAQQRKYLSEETMDFIVPGEYQIEQYFGKYMLSAEKTEQIPVFLKNPCTKCFDYGRINDGLLLRHRRSGDYMQIDRQGNTKPLRRILIDAKVPEHVRDSLWLLADGAHILWIPGAADGRISEYYKVSQNTKHVLMIKIKGEEKMEDKIRVLLTEEEVDEKIKQLGLKISEDYAGRSVHLICVLKGGAFFMCELAKRITVPVSMDFMSVSSYGNGTATSGAVKIIKDLDEPIEDKDVLIVEDIIDSGTTLHYLTEILYKRKPASIRICTLLDKPERRTADVKVDYVGFNIPDEFVVGYGLDYAQKYRNLPYIGVVEVDK